MDTDDALAWAGTIILTAAGVALGNAAARAWNLSGKMRRWFSSNQTQNA